MSIYSPTKISGSLLAAMGVTIGITPQLWAQSLTEIDQETLFISQTQATAEPELGTQVGGVVGDLTFTTPAGSSLSFTEFTSLIPTTPDLAISGVENLNIALAAPVFSLGFQFVDPTDAPDSTFDITLYSGGAGGTFVNSFNFESPKDVLHFGGFVSDTAFDYVEIREIGGDSGNEYFGQFYTGTTAGEFWTAGTSGNWDTGANWTGSTAPLSTDNVFITDSATMTITGPASARTVNSLTIDNQDLTNSGGTGTTTLNLSTGALTVTNGFVVGSTATDSGISIVNVGAGTLNVGGDTTIRDGGTLNVGTGTFNPTGAVNLEGGTLSVNSIGSLTPNWTSGTLEVTGAGGLAVNLNGSLGGNPIDISTGKTLNVTNLLQVNSAVIFDVDGGSVNAGNITAFLGTFNANIGQVNVDNTFTNFGTVNLAGADVTVNTFDASAVTPNFTDGSLTIDGGAYIPFAGSPDFTLESATGNPTLTLDNGATLGVTGTIDVALNANTDATLNINNGSSLTSGAVDMGGISFTSDAIANVDGAGSSWDISGTLEIGHGNTTTQAANTGRDVLTVSNGAELNVDGAVTLYTTGRINIDDGDVTVKGWDRLAASQFGWYGGTLTIDTGNFNSGTSNFTLGHADRNVLNMINGATHTGTNVDITNGEWHVLSGSGVNLTGSASLQLYNNGAGSPALMEIDGAGSSVTVNGILDVGTTTGGDATLHITNGGSLTINSSASIAESDTTVGIVNVDGTGSSLNVNAGFFVGNEGAATLNITNGASVNVNELTVADSDTNGINTGVSVVTINGTDGVTPSTLNVTGSSYIGGSTNENGGVGVLNVQAGALYASNGGIIGSGDGGGADGTGTVNITGADSFWNSVANGNSDIYVGDDGAGALNVNTGGRVDADAMFIGRLAGSEAAQMSVDGNDSVVNVRGAFVVGNQRPGALEITNNATLNTSTLTNAEFLIGNSTASDNSSVLVDNASIVHNGTGRVAVGDDSNGVASSLTIQNGGSFTASNSNMLVADQAGSTGSLVVDGEGSTLTVGRMLMGDNGSGTATISNGGDLIITAPGSQIGNLEVSAFGGGNGTMTVTDPGSTVSVGDWLSVGDEGTANGTLNIENGATVSSNGHSYIARQGYLTSTGVITVQDLDTNDGSSGSTLNVGANLYLSGNASGGGGDATLNVNAGGTVNVTGQLKLWDDGKVNLNGGTINAGSLDLFDPLEAPLPVFTFNSGTFRFTAGATLNSETLRDLLGGVGTPVVSTGRNLVVTDQAVLSAPVRLSGGTLSVGSVFNNDTSNLDFDAGTFNLTSSNLEVTSGGLFGSVLSVTPNQAINITNLAQVNADGTLVVQGGFSSGGLTNLGTTVLIDTTIGGPVNNPSGSAIDIVGEVIFTGLYSGGGDIFGSGTADFQGGISPGDSPAIVSIEGSINLDAANTLFIELGGTTPGEYDRLELGGFASIDGTLDVALINGFVPSVGDSFGFLFANGGFGGSFATLSLPDLSSMGLDWQLNPGGSTVFLEVVAALQGDLNGDGFVGLDDLDIVLGNWNQSVPPANPLADPSGDGFVGLDDLDIVLTNWNNGTPPSGVAVTVVPEPAGLVVISALSMLCLAKYRSRR